MRTRPILLALALISTVLISARTGHAQLSSYDTFQTAQINPRKWFGEEGRTFGGIRTEARRAIVPDPSNVTNRQARIELRSYGDTFNNSGFSFSRNSLIALKSPAITAMRATITARSLTLVGCPANTGTATAVRARILGTFFNAGEGIVGSSVNDVFAGIQLQRLSNSTDAAGVLRVIGFFSICNDENCENTTTLGSVELGQVNLGVPATVEMRWEPASNRFVYQLDSNPVEALNYTLADTAPPSFSGKQIGIGNVVPRCTAPPRPVAFMSADFDNVMVNSSALSSLAPTLAATGTDTDKDVVVDELVGPVK